MDLYEEGLSNWVENFLFKGVFATDKNLKIILWNRWLEEKSGLFSEKLMGKNVLEVFPETIEKKADRYFYQALNGEPILLSHRFHKYLIKIPPEKDFSNYFSEMQQTVQIAPLISNNILLGTITMIEDVTERVYTEMLLKKKAEILKEAEEEAKKERDLAQHYLNIVGVIILILDKNGNIELINKRGCEILGYKKEELIGKNWFDTFIVDSEKEEVKKVFKGLMNGDLEPFEEHENFIKTKSRGIRIIHWHNTILKDSKGKITGVLSSGEDITEKKQLEEILKSMVITDELTGLNNRRGFLTLAGQQLKIAQRTGENMLLFFIDIDNMKWINDTLGHNAGDIALKNTAKILKETYRESDIISRFGGDEFAVLVLDTHPSNAQVLIERLKENIKKQNEKNENGFKFSLSIGFSIFNPENAKSLDELITEADAMMYEDKKRKKYNE
ncbi:MAG TPA: diguanylate cyclase [Syntrophorhabdaceae bacterium]|nr:diguanylate cyclase [Syntrophorhabdaceae bacterium]HPU30532.1 diguanylate cyclase [Syntrophorhabdaceae bacterium]